MRILQLTHYYPEHKGGIETVAGQLVKSLIQDYKVEVEWIASDIDPPPKDVKGLTCTPVKTLNIIEEIIGISYPIWGLDFLFKVWRAIKNSDVVLLHDYIYMGNIVAFLFAKIYKKPVLLMQYVGQLPYKNKLFRNIHTLLNRIIGKIVLKNVNQLIFCNEVVQKYFTGYLDISRTTTIIRNGIDHDIYFPVSESKRNQIRIDKRLPDDKPVFLFVGRFVEIKGLHLLKELVKRFSLAHWIFIGFGPLDPIKWELPNISVYYRLQSNEIAPFYQTADLLVFPSQGEPSPLVVQEAIACGLPAIVGSDIVANRDVNHLLFFEEVSCSNAVDKWSVKIKELIENKGMLLEIRSKLSSFPKENWCWKRTAMQYYEIIESSLVG